MKEYSSFDEIDRDLKILKLQNEIDKEEIKLSISRTKEALSPVSLLTNVARAAVKKALVLKAITKVMGKKLGRKILK